VQGSSFRWGDALKLFEEQFDLLDAFIGEGQDSVVIVGAVDPDDAVLGVEAEGQFMDELFADAEVPGATYRSGWSRHRTGAQLPPLWPQARMPRAVSGTGPLHSNDDDAQARSIMSHGSCCAANYARKDDLRAQPRYRVILAQGGPRRRRTMELTLPWTSCVVISDRPFFPGYDLES
jgi:hypothetical protein